MINVRNLDSNTSRTNQALKWASDSYRAADNAAGDSDTRTDRISLSDGKTSTEVQLSGDLFNKAYVEKVTGPGGDVSITAVTVPTWLNPFGTGSAYVVERSGQGAYTGLEHEYQPNGGFDYYRDVNLDAATAQRRFAALDSAFINTKA